MINEENIHDEKINIANAMIRFGGSFVQSLGVALLNADRQNTIIIKNSFPHYWKQYKEFHEKTK